MKYLILGPGGQAFFMMVGYLSKIEKELEDLEEIAGCSAGAVLGFYLAVGKTPSEILDFSINIDQDALAKMHIKNLLKNFGLIDTSMAKQTFLECVGCNPQFKDLKKKLHISATCVNTAKTVYFSNDTHPDMYVIDAVIASMSVPIMFAASRYQGNLYMDGATLEEIPGVPFLNKNADEVLAIQVKIDTVNTKVDSIKRYIENIIMAAFLTRIQYPHYKKVVLDCGNIDLLNWKMTVEDKLRLFIIGQS